jgi:hypothetical protein
MTTVVLVLPAEETAIESLHVFERTEAGQELRAVLESPIELTNSQFFQIVDGGENPSTTTLKSQRFNIKDTILNGKENLHYGK